MSKGKRYLLGSIQEAPLPTSLCLTSLTVPCMFIGAEHAG